MFVSGGACFGQEEVTYEVKSTTSVTASKEISGVTYSFKNTYTANKEQLTAGNSMTLTLKGFPYAIKQLKLNLHRNNSKGQGNLNVTVGNTNIYSKKFVRADLTQNYKEYTFDIDSYTATGDVVIKLEATENSLFCNSFTIVSQADGKTPTTLSFGSDYDGKTVTKYVGDIYEATATLSPAVVGATITYKSSDESVAEVVDGLVEAKNVGTATITASYAGNDTYNASTATYDIVVKYPKGQVPDGVFDFTSTEDYGSGLTPRNDYGTEYDDNTTWVAGNVTITTSKGTGNGVRWWSTSSGNELRLYKNSKLSISVPDGYVITNIDLGGVYGSMTVDCGTLNNSKWIGASQKVTITPSATKNIKSITVIYTKTATLTTAASGFSTYAADYDVDYSKAGLTAYAITLDEVNNRVAYTETTGVVPAGKAVLVKGEPQTDYTLAPATDAAGEFNTDLQVSDGTISTADQLYYAFGTLNGISGFKLLADGLTIPAKKGYLKLSTSAGAKSFFEFNSGTTAINGIKADNANDVIYNLAGQHVTGSYKGLVIKNGKKYIAK